MTRLDDDRDGRGGKPSCMAVAARAAIVAACLAVLAAGLGVAAVGVIFRADWEASG